MDCPATDWDSIYLTTCVRLSLQMAYLDGDGTIRRLEGHCVEVERGKVVYL
jgi:hypothetical protein